VWRDFQIELGTQPVPLKIISKAILRHHDLKTIQIYLGKVSDDEAIRGWITGMRKNIILRGLAQDFYKNFT
jgi:hypothetical protein